MSEPINPGFANPFQSDSFGVERRVEAIERLLQNYREELVRDADGMVHTVLVSATSTGDPITAGVIGEFALSDASTEGQLKVAVAAGHLVANGIRGGDAVEVDGVTLDVTDTGRVYLKITRSENSREHASNELTFKESRQSPTATDSWVEIGRVTVENGSISRIDQSHLGPVFAVEEVAMVDGELFWDTYVTATDEGFAIPDPP